MGGQTGMGGAATPQTAPTQGIQANMGPGSMGATGGMAGGFDLSKLFMGNAPTTPAGGGQQLPQIMAPARQPMPTMPSRAPMPQAPQAQNPFWYQGPDGRYMQASSMSAEEAQNANRRMFLNNRERGRGGR